MIFNYWEKIWRVSQENGKLEEVINVNPVENGGRKVLGMDYSFYASLSPDGSQITYATCQYDAHIPDLSGAASPRAEPGYEIAMINIDGTGQRRLTGNPYFEHFPVWSPDGTKIAYIGNTGRGDDDYLHVLYEPTHTQLRIKTDDGTGTFQTTAIGPENVALFPPVWAPDSQRLAFSVFQGKYSPHWQVIHTIRADGKDLQSVGVASTLPTWSPDGERLAFARSTDVSSVIYTVRFDGTDLSQIWSSEDGEQLQAIESVDWSPDGSEILVVSRLVNEKGRIWIISPDGSETRSIGHSGSTLKFEDAVWSPDGQRIAAWASEDPLKLRAFYDDQKSLTVVTLARDGTDLRVLVAKRSPSYPHSDDLSIINEVNPSSFGDPIDTAVCSEAMLVPEPEENPGLVDDCSVLLGIRDKLAGRALLNWAPNLSILEWDGVEIEGNPARVRTLDVRSRGLTGTIPPELAQLTEIKGLYLDASPGPRANILSGSIPPELGNLSKLEGLGLSGNLLSGSIPPELGNLSELERLWLSGNFLSGSIPEEMGQLENLRALGIRYNFFSGCIPEGLRDIERHDFEDTGLEFCGEVEAEVQ